MKSILRSSLFLNRRSGDEEFSFEKNSPVLLISCMSTTGCIGASTKPYEVFDGCWGFEEKGPKKSRVGHGARESGHNIP